MSMRARPAESVRSAKFSTNSAATMRITRT
jgi:hypothetical protein